MLSNFPCIEVEVLCNAVKTLLLLFFFFRNFIEKSNKAKSIKDLLTTGGPIQNSSP